MKQEFINFDNIKELEINYPLIQANTRNSYISKYICDKESQYGIGFNTTFLIDNIPYQAKVYRLYNLSNHKQMKSHFGETYYFCHLLRKAINNERMDRELKCVIWESEETNKEIFNTVFLSFLRKKFTMRESFLLSIYLQSFFSNFVYNNMYYFNNAVVRKVGL